MMSTQFKETFTLKIGPHFVLYTKKYAPTYFSITFPNVFRIFYFRNNVYFLVLIFKRLQECNSVVTEMYSNHA